tara:strand:- start:345 stop:647 length:303 start_codon:yes stop_codon:yes gene_type:complete
MEFGNDIDYLIKLLDRNIVTSSKISKLEKRIKCIEEHLNLYTSDKLVVVETIVAPEVSNSEKDVKEEDIQIRITENTRSVLLKSPETINDDSWVHVNDIV